MVFVDRTALTTALEPPRLAASSMADRAYVEIRDRILTLDMKPGSLIHEDNLRQELQLGRTPIREALKRLAFENLVMAIPRRGTFVSEIHITDLALISEVRVELESYAARLAANRAPHQAMVTAETLIQELEGLAKTVGHLEQMRLDQRVHRFIYECVQNPLLEETLDRYYTLALRIWFLVLERISRLDEAVEEHRDLLRAIQARDSERAEEVMRRHVLGFEAEIRKAL